MRSASAFLSAACLAGFVSLFATNACEPNQGPGERCDTDQDCQSGLTCSQRVCCQPGASCVTATATDSGPAIDTGTPIVDTGVPDAIGKACKHNTDCATGLSCLAGGTCGLQCVGDRDCNPGDHCDCPTFSCQSGTSGGAASCIPDAAADTSTAADTAVTDSGASDTSTADTSTDDTLDAAETD